MHADQVLSPLGFSIPWWGTNTIVHRKGSFAISARSVERIEEAPVPILAADRILSEERRGVLIDGGIVP